MKKHQLLLRVDQGLLDAINGWRAANAPGATTQAAAISIIERALAPGADPTEGPPWLVMPQGGFDSEMSALSDAARTMSDDELTLAALHYQALRMQINFEIQRRAEQARTDAGLGG